MKIITISREFGSGGRELGKRLANILGYDYYDREIITSIASNTGMDENYIAQAMEQHRWQNMALNFHQSLAGISIDSTQTDLLLEQKHVIEQIAKTGKNCLIVGRNADILLREYQPFNIFVCADMDVKIQRCLERASKDEDRNPKEIKRKICRVDKRRAQTRELVTGSQWGKAEKYHITLNTTTWDITELAPAVADFIKSWYKRNNK
ncbi:MAG: cytidylate kinase-like family protein [Candidatus Neomarinimicrobiota bacterium]|jgi:cytidylate kinase